MLSLPGGFLETGLHVLDSRLLEVETDMTAYGGIILAVLLSRVWDIEALKCPKCGSQMKVISFFRGPVYPDAEFPVHICSKRRLTEYLAGGMVSFWLEMKVYRNYWPVWEAEN